MAIPHAEKRFETADCFFSPDMLVTCNRLLVAEVLIESTPANDRGAGFAGYRKPDSLQDSVLTDLAAKGIELFHPDPGSFWIRYGHGVGDTVELASLAPGVQADQLFEVTDEDGAAQTTKASQ